MSTAHTLNHRIAASAGGPATQLQRTADSIGDPVLAEALTASATKLHETGLQRLEQA
ncbi:hypothetical protein R0381_002068 [Jeongeupia wiesaeckerbachi]|uniref:hypothetical protein n=1 Tax=Jeongeupia wiesaeckerbachi TaxID=3051218 RepID=UPI003D80A232